MISNPTELVNRVCMCGSGGPKKCACGEGCGCGGYLPCTMLTMVTTQSDEGDEGDKGDKCDKCDMVCTMIPTVSIPAYCPGPCGDINDHDPAFYIVRTRGRDCTTYIQSVRKLRSNGTDRMSVKESCLISSSIKAGE
ncbi:hypothetical protein BZA05DRAFT_421632 [Tricharina praecox]|uniref:uncharacterized protein n=1 Tax=Tricharina praecox TaxID=43433 RepID=UPI00221EC0D7|nr:uncharacterized protein BZA05DRAFT_422977 [Tricharina praecox]XP_051336025.1 uncharacterized protein BZA05DRAFT_421632 [Tricharina praecox]KAI5840939.1 hypothetical protein BZA05DRAFT_422977 [Tricharina praecox]KAI5844698.1 hypothetical protein BZA05DRAFT_421632 [Tricharina praecox]